MGEVGSQPKSVKVAIVADIGPLAIIHLSPALLSCHRHLSQAPATFGLCGSETPVHTLSQNMIWSHLNLKPGSPCGAYVTAMVVLGHPPAVWRIPVLPMPVQSALMDVGLSPYALVAPSGLGPDPCVE